MHFINLAIPTGNRNKYITVPGALTKRLNRVLTGDYNDGYSNGISRSCKGSRMNPPAAIESTFVRHPDLRCSRAWNILRRLLGLVLIAAAILKGNELATLPLLGDGLLNQRWLLVCLIELEAVLGAWLLIGLAGSAPWAFTLLVWLAFLTVAGYEVASGADSCGCFGWVPVNSNPTG